MTNDDTVAVKDPVFGDLVVNWKWMLGLGILMVVLGVIGLGMTYWLTVLSVLWFGVLAVIGGVAQLIEAFKCSGWKSIASHVLLGLLYLAAGVVLIAMPIQSAWWLTLLIGAALVVTGLLRIVMAFQMRAGGSAWIWLVLTGLVSIALGIIVYTIVDLPTEQALASAEGAAAWFQEWGWVIGLFVAIEFIVHGASLAALALAARTLNQNSADAGRGTPPSSPPPADRSAPTTA